MARTIEKLSPAAVQRASKPGLYGDGGGLWLHVGKATKRKGDKGKLVNKSWILRFMIAGRARSMGLGALHTVSLAEARERARKMRHLLLDGIDPIDQRHAERRARRREAARAVTFKQVAERYIKANRAGWRNTKHATQWSSTLETYVYPTIGNLAVGDVETGHITRVLEPIWTKKPETASRVRGRIESVLDYAKVNGWRSGENPARWRGHLENVLPKKTKVAAIEHHAALPYRGMHDFVTKLREQEGVAARALEFAILTAARTGEVIGATWAEMDLGARVWTVPSERMKAGKPHRVPLSVRAAEIVTAMLLDKGKPDPADFVFPGGKPGKPLSNMALLMTLRRMGRSDLTAHGFRSSFHDWCAERTSYPSEVAEMALAHAVGDKVEAAYRRGDLFEKRRRLADEWAQFCSAPFVAEDGKVVALHSGAVS